MAQGVDAYGSMHPFFVRVLRPIAMRVGMNTVVRRPGDSARPRAGEVAPAEAGERPVPADI